MPTPPAKRPRTSRIRVIYPLRDRLEIGKTRQLGRGRKYKIAFGACAVFTINNSVRAIESKPRGIGGASLPNPMRDDGTRASEG
jgi:hypothetical protein